MTTVLYVPHFKTPVVGKQLMAGMCTCNQLSKRSQHAAVTLRKPTSIRSAYLYHTHMHMALWLYVCMYACSCMPTTLSPSPGLSPLAHSNRMSQRMYTSVPRCMPIARLGLIHNTMPSHIRKPFSKSLVNVRVRGMYVRVHACVCVCHKGQIESLCL